jgi:hypothetical protein
MNARRLAGCFAMLVSMLVLSWGTTATASLTHPLLSSFGTFTTVGGVAIDQATGDVYVFDRGSGGSLYKFDASGNPLKFTGLAGEPEVITGLGAGGASENEIAVDSSNGSAKGDIYLAASTGNGERIDVIASNGESLGALSASTAPWGETCGVAVDSSGAVYVGVYSGSIDKFVPTANPVTNTDYVSSISGANHPCNIAVDSAGNVFASTYSQGPITKYPASQFGLLNATGSTVSAKGRTLAVDGADGHLFVDQGEGIAEFGQGGEPFEEPLSMSYVAAPSEGVAVNEATGHVYVGDGSGHVEILGPSATAPTAVTNGSPTLNGKTAILAGTVDPEGLAVTGCKFEYGTTSAYGQSAPCAASPGAGSAPVGVTAEVSGLALSTEYHFRLVASNANGENRGEDETFVSPTPAVTGEAFEVTTDEATLEGTVNAEGQSVTACEIEYGTTSVYGQSVQCPVTPSGEIPVRESARVSGLQFLTTYHFRIVAVRSGGEIAGEDASFVTPAPGNSTSGLGLPDDRVYELVSPLKNNDAEVYRPAGVTGESSQVETELPFQASADGDGFAYVGSPSVGGSESAGQWGGNEYLATRSPDGGWTQANISPLASPSSIYQGFSSDLSVGFLDSLDALAPTVQGYGQALGESTGYYFLYSANTNAATEEYNPFFTTTPPYRSKEQFHTARIYRPNYNGRSRRTLSSLAYAGASEDSSHLIFEANDALTPNAEGGSEERFVEDNNLYESVGGQLRLVNVLPDGTTKVNASFGAPEFEAPSGEPGQSGSPDFSHVISEDGSRIFWTDLNTGHIYVREDGVRTVEISSAGKYWTATADGSKVYYTNGDLYEYAVDSGDTTDLTPGVTVLGVVGASENGEYIYYVTASYELEVWHNGTINAIRTLRAEDDELGHGDWRPGFGNRSAEVTPDGHGAVFMSKGAVVVYEADDGRVYCASCGSGGSEGILPQTYSNTYLKREISEGGNRVFFESFEGLVPQDTNGRLDAYEWERPGYGTCGTNTSGCIYLLSGGTSVDESYFADASASGDDAFVVTRAKLLPEDVNEDYDLYDARVDGFTAPTPLACTGTGCQGLPGAPPIFATPSSVTFEGVGNFAAAAPVKAKQKPKAPQKKKKKAKRKAKKHGKAHKKAKARKGRTSRRGGRS